MIEKKTVEGHQTKRFKCKVRGRIDCPNLKDVVEDFTTVTLDVTNFTKEDIDLVKEKAKKNVLFKVARENNIIPEYVFWLNVNVEILGWVVSAEIEGEQFTQFALDL